MNKVRCNKETDTLLVLHKKHTGISKTKLVEYAVRNMPYIPKKPKKNE